jgi:hypothetical protein
MHRQVFRPYPLRRDPWVEADVTGPWPGRLRTQNAPCAEHRAASGRTRTGGRPAARVQPRRTRVGEDGAVVAACCLGFVVPRRTDGSAGRASWVVHHGMGLDGPDGGRIGPRRATLVWAHVASLRTQRGHVGPQAVRCPPALSQLGHRPLPPGPSSIPPDRSLVHGPIGPVPLRRWCRHVGHHHRRPCSAAWVGYVHRRFRWRGGPVGWIVDLDRTAGDAL